MQNLKKHWQQLSAKKQVFFHAVTVVTLLFLCYAFLGCPALTVRGAFRRAQKAALTGPSVILAQMEPRNYPYDALIAARDEDGVVLFACDRKDPGRTELVYREEPGPVTILAAPGDTLLQFETKAVIPVVLFHERDDAFRAEAELTLQSDQFEKTYLLSAEREQDGCFCFLLTAQNAASLGEEGIALQLLQEVCSNSMAGNLDVEIPATVRLYDRAGALILKESCTIRSAAAQAQAKS